MKYLDLTLPTPAENLALEEALLQECEDGTGPEVLRLWEPPAPCVVLGYANRVSTEVRPEVCAGLQIPILRRISGGGTVVLAPGVLCYAVILRLDRDPALGTIAGANAYVLDRVARAVSSLVGGTVQREGSTDLVFRGRKFAGNAQRRQREALLFHGSLLVSLDLGLVHRLLPMPSRQPDYRADRPHAEFLANLEVSQSELKQALREAWEATDLAERIPIGRAAELDRERYAHEAWNLRS